VLNILAKDLRGRISPEQNRGAYPILIDQQTDTTRKASQFPRHPQGKPRRKQIRAKRGEGDEGREREREAEGGERGERSSNQRDEEEVGVLPGERVGVGAVEVPELLHLADELAQRGHLPHLRPPPASSPRPLSSLPLLPPSRVELGLGAPLGVGPLSASLNAAAADAHGC
jgi:hypothetical protein